MADPAVLQYWDSVVFISYLTGTDPDRTKVVQTLLRHVEQGKIRLATSTFTIAEVRYFTTDQTAARRNNPDREKRIEELFESDQIEFRAVTDFIAREARQIGCTYNQLSPADCVHIASAVDVGAAVLLTWDGASPSGKRAPDKMLTHSQLIGTPPLEIVVPYDPWPSLGLSDGDIGQATTFALPGGTLPLSEQSPAAPGD
jgi:predicted nucleic acid-binding protein